MTDTISDLSKWTKEKLVCEVIELRNQRRESLNLANKNQEKNQELDRLKLELEHQKELYNQSQSEIHFLRSQNDKLKSNLISEKTVEKRLFLTARINWFAKMTLVMRLPFIRIHLQQ